MGLVCPTISDQGAATGFIYVGELLDMIRARGMACGLLEEMSFADMQWQRHLKMMLVVGKMNWEGDLRRAYFSFNVSITMQKLLLSLPGTTFTIDKNAISFTCTILNNQFSSVPFAA